MTKRLPLVGQRILLTLATLGRRRTVTEISFAIGTQRQEPCPLNSRPEILCTSSGPIGSHLIMDP